MKLPESSRVLQHMQRARRLYIPINNGALQTLEETDVTCQMQVGTQSVASYPPECSLHSLDNDAPHSVLEADALDGIVIAQRFGPF